MMKITTYAGKVLTTAITIRSIRVIDDSPPIDTHMMAIGQRKVASATSAIKGASAAPGVLMIVKTLSSDASSIVALVEVRETNMK